MATDNTLKDLKELKKKYAALIDIEQNKKSKYNDKKDEANAKIDDYQLTKQSIQALIDQLEK